ncbi:response regulator transcription factor [Geotalea sp. SG265]|uniref:response regulator n=1 Tax=Geotalea sp. SG265 TaxID=2922867 RepID=UPI001FAFE919|nr:response regulator transcription factor [Geotalea sp. SG265]
MTKKKILIVDDSELVLMMARDALEAAGYTVFCAQNGLEANSYIFSADRPDLIIMDVMLPMLEGNKKVKLLKEKDLISRIPILLLSSKSEDELRRLQEESGADGYIGKPFSPASIVAAVRNFLT